jgi:hypothetical protein
MRGGGLGLPDRVLVSETTLAGLSGRFFDRTREARANAQAYDARARTQLWQRSLELTDVKW